MRACVSACVRPLAGRTPGGTSYVPLSVGLSIAFVGTMAGGMGDVLLLEHGHSERHRERPFTVAVGALLIVLASICHT